MKPQFGVSFSVKQCRNFSLDSTEVLQNLLEDLGVRRFRLMSYWNEIEKSPSIYSFEELDAQVALIQRHGGEISLCLGARQPRWPENHWPDWVWSLDYDARTNALLNFITTVVNRYKDNTSITSYQLENEALLANFGQRPEVNRNRLVQEFKLVTQLDPSKPVIMTTSTSWGIPLRKPIPDIVGFSYYQVLFNNGSYGRSFHRPWLDRARARAITLLHKKPSFIHELQAEPWGPKNIWEMPKSEQNKSMSIDQLRENITQARATNLYPIDLWGAEWWYWLQKQGDTEIWDYMKTVVCNTTSNY